VVQFEGNENAEASIENYTTQTMTCPSGIEMIPERSSIQQSPLLGTVTFSRSGQAMHLIIMA
jgi:hypothetical protein